MASMIIGLVACFAIVSITQLGGAAATDAGAVDWPLAKRLEGLTLAGISGVWQGAGDQIPKALWDAYSSSNTMPNCSDSVFTYQHWHEPFPDMLALVHNESTGAGMVVQGHHNGTYVWEQVGYAQPPTMTYTYEGEAGCVGFVPYVDLRTGMVYAQSMYKTEWKQQDGGNVTSTDLSCYVKEMETPGCYPQGDGVVHTVSIATHICKGGNCLNWSPAYHDYGHS